MFESQRFGMPMHRQRRGGNDTLSSATPGQYMGGTAVISGTPLRLAPTPSLRPGNNADTINDFRQTDHDPIDVSAMA